MKTILRYGDKAATSIRRWTVDVFGYRFGLERSTIAVDGLRYLDRWIIYAGGTLRLHRFTRGDDARALHDHPWWFITFPLSTYGELHWRPLTPGHALGSCHVRAVHRFRFHYRPPLFRHRVLPMAHPVWTIVLTGHAKKHGRTAVWGFYPKPDEFVPYTDWKGAGE